MLRCRSICTSLTQRHAAVVLCREPFEGTPPPEELVLEDGEGHIASLVRPLLLVCDDLQSMAASIRNESECVEVETDQHSYVECVSPCGYVVRISQRESGA